MPAVRIRKGKRSDSRQFLGLLRSLAEFERLTPPSEAAKQRILKDVFARKRVCLFVASEGSTLVGYAIYFYSYSSFLARPTLYLEDLFVREEQRKRGVGLALFRRCVDEAIAKGCGRMEWSVLAWNEKALRFYERLGARRLSEWYVYRLDEKGLGRVPKAPRRGRRRPGSA
ncbi:MAG: GNAT family N-acetyltransferase [Nitrososphaerota archaeon]|nr:GNAT family N-acetyltransferase [Nitrososphaerota archaeon]